MRTELYSALNQIADTSMVIYCTSNDIKKMNEGALDQFIETCDTHVHRVTSSLDMAVSNYGDKYGIPTEYGTRGISDAEVVRAEEVLEDVRLLNGLSTPAAKGFGALIGRRIREEDYRMFCQSAMLLKRFYTGKRDQAEAYKEGRFNSLPKAKEEFAQESSRAKTNISETMDAWETYPISAKLRCDDIYIGDIQYDLWSSEGLESMVQMASDKETVLSVPFAYSGERPFALFITYEGDEIAKDSPIENLIRGIIYQILRGMAPYTFNLTYIDPVRGGALLGEINSGLLDARDSNAYWLNNELYQSYFQLLNVASTRDQTREEFKRLANEVAHINLARNGMSVAEANIGLIGSNDEILESERGLIMQKFVIIENTHNFFSQDTYDTLRTLIENYADCGITLILVSSRNKGEALDQYELQLLKEVEQNRRMDHLDIFWNEKAGRCANIRTRLSEDDRQIQLFPFLFSNTPVLHKEFIGAVCDYYCPKLNVETGYTKRVAIDEEWGKYSAEDCIEIPIGVNVRNKVTTIQIGNTQNTHGMLSGMIGSGKSSFLHTIINGVVSRYSPYDVQIWLSDYKSVEFRRYMTNTPPHIKHIGISTQKEYTYAFLDDIWAEYERRKRLFGSKTSLKEFREFYGKDSMPRLFVIIDEFHVMSNHVKDEPKYKEKLTALLRECRATGITFLLADQACSVGLKGLEEDALMQIALRMSMRQEKIEEYNAIFDIKNAGEIIPQQSVYEVVVRRYGKARNLKGEILHTKTFEHNKTLYVDPETRSMIAQKSIETYGDTAHPKIVMSAQRDVVDWERIADYESKNPLRRGVPLYLGMPIKGGMGLQIILQPDYTNNVFCITPDEQIRADLFIHLLESVHRVEKREIYVLANPYDVLFEITEQKLDAYKVDSDFHVVTEPDEICRTIFTQMIELEKKRKRTSNVPVFLFWIGMNDILRDMEYYPKTRPDGENIKIQRKPDLLDSTLAELDAALSALANDPFASAFDDLEPALPEVIEEESEAGSPWLYDASEDIAILLNEGARRSVFSLSFFSSYAAIKRNRTLRMDNFKHRVANGISMEDAADILGSSQHNRDLEGKALADDVAVYYDGAKVERFMPYILPDKVTEE